MIKTEKLRLLEEFWHNRNPCHENDQEGNDRFWETVLCVFNDYEKALTIPVVTNRTFTNRTLKCVECKNYSIKVINKEGGTVKVCKVKTNDSRVIVDLKPKECADYVYGW